MVSFVPTLFGCFLGIPSLYVFSFSKMLFCDFDYTALGASGTVLYYSTCDMKRLVFSQKQD